jgi:circadian clock protein KaiC
MKTARGATRDRAVRTLPPGTPTPMPMPGVEKLATGIAVFDEITAGGLPKARASIVVGAAGTGKTIFTLQVLRHAALARGEASIFVSFEERPEDIVRNVASFDWGLNTLVGRQLHLLDGRMPLDVRHTGDADLSGLLAGLAAPARRTGARWVAFDSLDAMLSLMVDDAARRREVMRLHQWIETHGLTCLVTTKRGADWGTAMTEESRLSYLVDCVIDLESQMVDTLSMRTLRFQLCKLQGITLLMPCIVSRSDFDTESSDIHASTMADVWIHLSCLVRAGERNRLLTVVKARGTAHSN